MASLSMALISILGLDAEYGGFSFGERYEVVFGFWLASSFVDFALEKEKSGK